MTSALSKSSVFTLPSEYRRTALSTISIMESVFEKLRFNDQNCRLRVDPNPKRIKKIRFQKDPDTCGRGVRSRSHDAGAF